MSLQTVRLQDLCISISDGDHQAPPKSNSGIPFITISNITSMNQLDLSSSMFVPRWYYEKLDFKRKAQKNDILYSVVGSFGIPVFMKNSIEFIFQRHIALLRPNIEKIVPQYLYYVMLDRAFYMMADSLAIGAAQRTITLSSLRNIEITIPEVEQQQNIVDILSAYDDLIENNQKQIKLLEEAAQRLYKEWFIDLRFPGHENVEIIDGIPEGWSIRPFNEVFSYVRGKSYKSSELSESEGVLLVNLKNINAFGGYKRNAEKRYLGTYKADQNLDAGDIVMGVTDMTQERRLVGHVAIVPDLGESMTFSMDLIKLIPKSITRGYLYSAMRFGRYSEQISLFANGVNVLHLKPEAIMNMIMMVPGKDILERYESLFESYRKKIELLEMQSNYLTEARDRLLPKLMSGEIEV